MKKQFFISILIISILCFTNPISGDAQAAITVTRDRIISKFPDKLTFELSANSSAEIQSITLLYRTNSASCQTAQAKQEIDFDHSPSIETSWDWDFTLSGVLPPGAEIYWQWQISDVDGNNLLTEEQSFAVNDPRHTWNLLTRGQVNIQWYTGSSSFGQTLADIASQSIARLSEKAGIGPSGPIWITIYPTTAELKEVDIHTVEWAGGLAYPEYNSSIIAINTDELAWAAYVIPHELAHLVTESVMFNCKGMWLPTWLSEGLSTVAEGEIPQEYISMVTSALKKNSLPPLRTLESGFSKDTEAASLSYGHSGMVVNYMIDQYGSEKMADLLETIKSGLRIDKALLAVYGLDTDGIEARWRISLGYEPQPTLVPTSPTKSAVPTMALWTSVVRPKTTPTSLPTLTPQPPATDTPQIIPSVKPTQPLSTATSSPVDTPVNPDSPTPTLPYLILGIIIAIVAAGILLFFILRKRRKSI